MVEAKSHTLLKSNVEISKRPQKWRIQCCERSALGVFSYVYGSNFAKKWNWKRGINIKCMCKNKKKFNKLLKK